MDFLWALLSAGMRVPRSFLLEARLKTPGILALNLQKSLIKKRPFNQKNKS